MGFLHIGGEGPQGPPGPTGPPGPPGDPATQTPWASDIDAAGFKLMKAADVQTANVHLNSVPAGISDGNIGMYYGVLYLQADQYYFQTGSNSSIFALAPASISMWVANGFTVNGLIATPGTPGSGTIYRDENGFLKIS